MAKKLEILIPQYKETDEIIKPLLDSIAIQQNINFDEIGVIIVNDGTDVKLSEKLLSSYPYKIDYYQNEHRGVSATRNACLDKATADYVMFCDADDMFFNVCGLYIIFREINNGGFDHLASVFVEEGRIPDTKEVVYINRGGGNDVDSTFVHGKVSRRQYLLDNNIRWNDNLTIHEDSYFNCLCRNLSNNVKACGVPFYLWKWRDESVCRHDEKYILKTYNNMLESNTALVNQFIERGKKEQAQFFSTSMILDAYFILNKEEWWKDENKDYRRAVEVRFARYYKDFEYLFNEIPIQVKQQIIVGQRNRYYQEGMFFENITFADWIKEIKKIEV